MTNRFATKTDAMIRYIMTEALKRANNARGPSAAQSAMRTVEDCKAELARRHVKGQATLTLGAGACEALGIEYEPTDEELY